MTLPAPTDAFLPQRPPLRLVQRLLRVKGDDAEAETVLQPGDLGVAPDGRLEAPVLVELIAQTYAAAQGHRDRQAARTPGLGYLVGAADVRIHSRPRAGQRLTIAIHATLAFENFHTVAGRVLADGQLVAEGTLKAWVQAQG